MRRTILLITAAVVQVLVFASIAYAETFEGGRGAVRYVGTPNSDRVESYGGDTEKRPLSYAAGTRQQQIAGALKVGIEDYPAAH
jgi:hypothetical protein